MCINTFRIKKLSIRSGSKRNVFAWLISAVDKMFIIPTIHQQLSPTPSKAEYELITFVAAIVALYSYD